MESGEQLFELRHLAFRTNNILDRYVSIHYTCFKFSLRKVIPLPGIFKPIDYRRHRQALNSLHLELEELRQEATSLAQTSRHVFLPVHNEYTQALSSAIIKLAAMCQGMHGRSEGDNGDTAAQYQADWKAYSDAVDQYKQVGSRLNEVFKTFLSTEAIIESGVRPSLIVPARHEVEDAKKVFTFYKGAVAQIEFLQQLKDKHLECIFQHGGRPKAGRANDPDSQYTDEAHLAALIKQTIPGLLPDADLLNPPKTLYEWTFMRFHLDLKNMARAPKDIFEAYLHLLEDGANEAEKEGQDLARKHELTKEMAFREDFHSLGPAEHYYFTCLLTQVASKSLRMMLSVVYLHWYPAEAKPGAST